MSHGHCARDRANDRAVDVAPTAAATTAAFSIEPRDGHHCECAALESALEMAVRSVEFVRHAPRASDTRPPGPRRALRTRGPFRQRVLHGLCRPRQRRASARAPFPRPHRPPAVDRLLDLSGVLRGGVVVVADLDPVQDPETAGRDATAMLRPHIFGRTRRPCC